MSRRAIRGLAVGAVALIGVLIALVVLRTAIVQYVIERDLRARGIPLERLTVSELGLDTAAVSDVRLGTGGEVAADVLRVDYDLSGLVQGNIRRIVLERPTVHLDLTGRGPPLGSLQSLLENQGGGAGTPALPPITIVDGTIQAQTPIGPVTANVDGTVLLPGAAPGEPLAKADLILVLQGEDGRLAGSADIAVQEGGRAAGDLNITEGTLTREGWHAEGISGGARFVWADGRPQDLNAALTLEGGAFGETSFRDARIAIDLNESDAEGTVVLHAADNSFTAELHGTLNDYLERPGARLEAELAAGVHAPLWPLLRLPAPAKGHVTAHLTADGRLPPLSQLAAADLTTVRSEIGDTLQGRLAVMLDGLTFTDRIEGISGSLGAQFGLEDQAVTLRLVPEAQITAARVAPRWLSAQGVPEAIAGRFEGGAALTVAGAPAGPPAVIWHPTQDGGRIEASGGVQLALAAGGDARLDAKGTMILTPARTVRAVTVETLALHLESLAFGGTRIESADLTGTLSGTPDALDGDFDVTLSLPALDLGGIQANGATTTLPVHLQRDPETLSLSLRSPGRLTADNLAYGDAVSTTAPIAVEIAAMDVRVARGLDGRGAFEHTIRVVPGSVRFQAPRGGAEFHARIDGIEAQGTLPPAGPYQGEITSEIPRLRFVGQDFALDGLVLVAHPGAQDGELVSIERGALRNVAKQPYLAPFYLWGGATLKDDTLAFSVGGRTAKGTGRLSLDGNHDLAAGRGAAKLALGPITFAPSSAQPAAVFPTLDDLKDASGTVRARADLSWGAKGLDGSARIVADSLSFLVPGAAVRDLNLDLALSSLFPPASRPGQALTIGAVDPGLPITDVSVLFEVLRGNKPRARISTARFGIAGGRISARDVLVDPAATQRAVTFEVDRLDLARVFDLLDIKGVSGTGQLSGTVPIALEGSDVRIQNGRLAAVGPGVLHLQSDTIEKALGAAGESADLIMRALADFRYDELTLDIATPSATLATVRLVLLGSNPKVLEGHPFRFNVNLETDPRRLLATLRDLSQISHRALRRLWMVGR